MPAGLLLSPTARTVRSGPFGEGPVGAVPFSLTRRPSSGLRLRRFPLIPAPEPPYPAPIPGKVVGAKARPQDTPSPPGSRYGFPPLPGETRILPALPSHGSIAPGVFLRPLSQAILPLFFPCRTSFAAVRPSRPFQARRLCAQPAFFQPSRHRCAKKNDFVKKKREHWPIPPFFA